MVLKDFFDKFKKGSLSTKQIVTMIILIAGFIVVLLFFSQLNLSEESKAQLCRNSVMQSSTTSSLSSSSLQCTTKYVCLTADGSCDEMVEPDETVEVDSKEEIYQELSEQKSQCWWMFGAGEIDYVVDDVKQNNYCSICHQTHFDDSLSSIEGVEESISKDELYNYMTENNYSDSQTYAQFILRTNDLNFLKERIIQNESLDASEISFGEIETGETYYDVMGITSERSTLGWVLTGAAVGGAIAIGVSTGAVTSYPIAAAIVLSGGGAGLGYAGSETIAESGPVVGALNVRGVGIDNRFMAPTFQKVESDKFKALNCEKVLTDSS